MPRKNGWALMYKDKGLEKRTVWKHEDTHQKLQIYQTDEDTWMLQAGDKGRPFDTKDAALGAAEVYKENKPLPEELRDSLQDRAFAMMMPKKYNNGNPVPQEKIDKYLSRIAERFGGFTTQEAEGGWKNNGQLKREPMLRVIMVRDGEDGVPVEDDEIWLESLADEIGDDLGQAEVLVTEETDGFSDNFVEGDYRAS